MEKRTINSTQLNIAIIPPDDISNEAIRMSKMIADSLESEFVLNVRSLIPHITIYQAEYPNKNINELKTIVKEISSKKSFKITLDEIIIFYNTFLFWKCKKDDNIESIQREVVQLANPLREGLILGQLASIRGLSEENRHDVENFGSLLIGSRYIPHITVTRLKREVDSKKVVAVLGESRKRSFMIKSIILGSLGPHGTVTNIVERFNFK
jgi:2'-5' RNA ligase